MVFLKIVRNAKTPNRNILALPFRRTHSVKLSAAIRQYISTKYDQHPDMFAQDLEAIDHLRADAVTSLEAHVSGIKKLSAYAAQLVWIGGKFPIDVSPVLVLLKPFKERSCLAHLADNLGLKRLGLISCGIQHWDSVHNEGVGFREHLEGLGLILIVSQNNLRFELANILFNLASLFSQLALSTNRSTSDGLKSAYNYFCQAAGVLNYLKTEIIPDLRSTPPDDMDLMTLESLEQLMLAQAQECFWSRAVKDGYKDLLISKLAAKVSDFYDLSAENGTKSDTISTEWIHHMTAKHHHFAAAAQYRAACDCLEKRKYGEEIARLRDSIVCVNEALKESRWINRIVLGDLNGLKTKVSEDLKRAEKDNDVIYLMPVPPKSELKTLDRASMATAKKPTDISDPSTSLGGRGIYGQPLFSKLVPYAVHVAASIYAERKDRLVKTSVIDELEGMTNQLRDLLQSLNLPGSLQALEKPLGLPVSLKSHAEEFRQQDGLHRLRRFMHDVEMLKKGDHDTYQEGVEFIRSEAMEDDHFKVKYGTDRWTRQQSQLAAERLYAQVGEIDGYLKSANSSDDLVRGKLKECESVLKILEGSDRGLEEYVPSSRRTAMPPELQRESTQLRTIINEVNRLESRRRRKAESIREKAKADDINPAILTETARLEREFPMQKIEAAQFEDLFEKQLERYNDDRMMINDEREEQDQLSSQLKEANRSFVIARRGDSSSRDRETALQSLENAYTKYKEIIQNLDTGRKFYNDLSKIVNRFRDDAKNFAYKRRQEAKQIES